MASVFMLRHGVGARRVAQHRHDIGVRALERQTGSRAISFVSSGALPALGEQLASSSEPACYVVIQIARDELTHRLDRPGFWLFQSLLPAGFDELMPSAGTVGSPAQASMMDSGLRREVLTDTRIE